MNTIVNYTDSIAVTFKNGIVVTGMNAVTAPTYKIPTEENAATLTVTEVNKALYTYYNTETSAAAFDDDEKNIDLKLDTIISKAARAYNVSYEYAEKVLLYHFYTKTTATPHLILCIEDSNKDLYAAGMNILELLNYDCFSLDYDSKNKSAALRLKLTKNLKKDVLKIGEKIADSERVKYAKSISGNNTGRAYEYITRSLYGGAVENDNRPYYDTGDVNILENTIQIKTHKASFCNRLQAVKYIRRYGYKPTYTFKIPQITAAELLEKKHLDIDRIIDNTIADGDYNERAVMMYTRLNSGEKYSIHIISNKLIHWCDDSSEKITAYLQLKKIAADMHITAADLLFYIALIDD